MGCMDIADEVDMIGSRDSRVRRESTVYMTWEAVRKSQKTPVGTGA